MAVAPTMFINIALLGFARSKLAAAGPVGIIPGSFQAAAPFSPQCFCSDMRSLQRRSRIVPKSMTGEPSLLSLRGGGADDYDTDDCNDVDFSDAVAEAAPPPSPSIAGLVNILGGAKSTEQEEKTFFPAWFKPGATNREKWLGLALLTWNAIAATDAFFYTFRVNETLDNYLTPGWDKYAVAQSRMLANCQWALILMTALTAWTGSESTIKNAFKIMILATLGAFRAVAAGVSDGTIKAPWKSQYTALMAFPPLLLLSYFAFLF